MADSPEPRGDDAPPPGDLDAAIGARLQALRQARGMSLGALAETSGVSKAMISRVERAQSSATAGLLGRLAAGLGLPLSELLVTGPPPASRLRRRADQPTWRDPERGYRRRQVAPADAASGVELVEVELPRRTAVNYPPWHGRPYDERVWVLEGRLQLTWGDTVFELEPGDSVDIAVDRALTFRSLGGAGCRYLLVIAAR